MKTIEFVKEVNDSDIFYYTQIDGMLKVSSMSFNKQIAYENYLKIFSEKGAWQLTKFAAWKKMWKQAGVQKRK